MVWPSGPQVPWTSREGYEARPHRPMDPLWKRSATIHNPRYNSTHDLEAVQHGKRPHVLHVAPHPLSDDLTCVSEVTSLGATPGTAGTLCITPGCPQQRTLVRGVIQKKETARRLKFRRYHLRAGLLTTATPFKCVVGRPLEESR